MVLILCIFVFHLHAKHQDSSRHEKRKQERREKHEIRKMRKQHHKEKKRQKALASQESPNNKRKCRRYHDDAENKKQTQTTSNCESQEVVQLQKQEEIECKTFILTPDENMSYSVPIIKEVVVMESEEHVYVVEDRMGQKGESVQQGEAANKNQLEANNDEFKRDFDQPDEKVIQGVPEVVPEESDSWFWKLLNLK